MNRRLPRFLLLVVLLIAMVGVLSLGGASPVRTSLAQEGQADPCSFAQSTPASESGVQVPDTERIDLDGTDTRAFVQVLVVPAGETVSLDVRPNLLVWVDGGEVTLTICEDDSVAVAAGDSHELEILVGPATASLDTGDSVYATSAETVHLTGVDPESRIILMVVIPPSGAVCGSGGC